MRRAPFTFFISLLSFGALAADEVPKRKSGLWHITMSGAHTPRMQVEECVDRASDDFFKPEDETSCSKIEIRRQGAGVNVETVCNEEGSTVTTRGAFTGDFDSAYKGNFKISYNPPMQGLRETTMQNEGRWVGPCKPGQQPGDINVIESKPVPKPR